MLRSVKTMPMPRIMKTATSTRPKSGFIAEKAYTHIEAAVRLRVFLELFFSLKIEVSRLLKLNLYS